jgi:hypothetical protein
MASTRELQREFRMLRYEHSLLCSRPLRLPLTFKGKLKEETDKRLDEIEKRCDEIISLMPE